MSKSTISTFQLFEMFPTAESARLYLESRLWPDGAFCPECKSRFRLNVGNVSRHTLERLDSFVVAVVGKHLTYKELTA
jgi:hypothetical protein